MTKTVKLLALVVLLAIAAPSFASSPVGSEITCTPPEAGLIGFGCVITNTDNPTQAAYVSAFGLFFVPFGPSLFVAAAAERYAVGTFHYHYLGARVSSAIVLLPTGWIWPDIAVGASQSSFFTTRTTQIELSARNSSTAGATVTFTEVRRPSSCTDTVEVRSYAASQALPTHGLSAPCPAPLPDLP